MSQHTCHTIWITIHRRDLDLHKGNIVLGIPDLDGKSEEGAMVTLGLLRCVPVFTRDRVHQSDSLPTYLVIPGSLVECVGQDDTRIKIIDLGEGSLWWSQSCCRVLSPHSILQHQGIPKSPHPVASSGTGDYVQLSLNVAQG